jgi:hypothetical protein
MTKFIAIEQATGRVDATYDAEDAPVIDGHDLVEAPVDFDRGWPAAPTDTAVLHWVDGALAWVETAPVADLIERGIQQIDGAADTSRLGVLSKASATEEYKRSEAQARAYRAAGYPPDDVPSCVASWAKAKRRDAWTAQQAADDIIATADEWYGLLDGIRDLRLCAKEDVRHAADSGEVAARVQQFSADLTDLMKGVS